MGTMIKASREAMHAFVTSGGKSVNATTSAWDHTRYFFKNEPHVGVRLMKKYFNGIFERRNPNDADETSMLRVRVKHYVTAFYSSSPYRDMLVMLDDSDCTKQLTQEVFQWY